MSIRWYSALSRGNDGKLSTQWRPRSGPPIQRVWISLAFLLRGLREIPYRRNRESKMRSGRFLPFEWDNEMFPGQNDRQRWKAARYENLSIVVLHTYLRARLRNRPKCIDLFNGQISKCVRKRDHFTQKMVTLLIMSNWSIGFVT